MRNISKNSFIVSMKIEFDLWISHKQKYIGQTGRAMHIWFKAHKKLLHKRWSDSNYAKYVQNKFLTPINNGICYKMFTRVFGSRKIRPIIHEKQARIITQNRITLWNMISNSKFLNYFQPPKYTHRRFQCKMQWPKYLPARRIDLH